MTTPLPRSLDPPPDESLPGYLLRLAHRLDLSPARLAAITGLAPTRSAVPAARMLALPPDIARTFAHATRLTDDEADALTLASLACRYPPLDLHFTGRNRVIHGVLVKENWILSRSTRYCPDCLAGDDSLIQQRHGGGWNRLWRLPIVFACTTHRRLLRHTCSACRDPVHHRRVIGSQLLPLPSATGLHPAACRNPVGPSRRGDRPTACGHRLDHPTHAPVADQDEHLLHLQQRLLDLLHPHTPAAIDSVSAPATPASFFVDLRILTCLITASWPAARHLATDPTHANLVTGHVRATRREIAAVRSSGRAVREIALYDRPPLAARACAALLAMAERITAADPHAAGDLLQPMVAAVPSARTWTRQFLLGDGYCSPGLRTALAAEIGITHLIDRASPRPRPIQPPPRAVRFGIQHIPAFVLPAWRQRYFAPFADITAHLLGRAVSIHLAQAAIGGPAADAGEQLGIPRTAARYAITVVTQQLDHRRQRAFNRAIDTLAETLNRSTSLTDYGRRRDALRTWTITAGQWRDLIAGLPDQPVNGRVQAHTHWGDGKRTLATVWVWVQLTCGEHIFATPIRPDPCAPRPGGPHARYVHTRWPLLHGARPGHYAALRQRLEIFVDRLAHEIDTGLINGDQ